MVKILTVAAIAFVLAAVNGVFMIPILHKLKFGQEIREEGPKWHKAKSGTPTMGGFIFIAAAVAAAKRALGGLRRLDSRVAGLCHPLQYTVCIPLRSAGRGRS